jgi:hypothetical protein
LEIKSIHNQDEEEWGKNHFGDVELGDMRRDQRAVTIAAAMARNPDKSIPQIFSRKYDVKAAYEFFKQADVTADKVQEGHRELVMAEINKPGRYLLIEDTASLSWSGNETIKGLGPVGDSSAGLQGFLLHSVLAVQWIREQSSEWPDCVVLKVLGLVDQQYYIRKPRPAGEPANDSKASKYRARESQLWEQAGWRIGEAPANKRIQWIRVCDRGADIYETMTGCQELRQDYVIRAAQDRLLSDSQGHKQIDKLFAHTQAQSSLGEFELPLRGRAGHSSRIAKMNVSAVEVWLRSPHRPGNRAGNLPPIRCTALRVWETKAPKGVEALEWILLTSLTINNFVQALEVALIYSSRWLIEEFHKALKSGTKAEELQLETTEALFAAIAIKSVVALRLIELRERLRLNPQSPAIAAGLSQFELDLLSASLDRSLNTVADVALAIGRLGGHINRKADGLPGWQTLFRGLSKLNDFVQGARISLKLKKFG